MKTELAFQRSDCVRFTSKVTGEVFIGTVVDKTEKWDIDTGRAVVDAAAEYVFWVIVPGKKHVLVCHVSELEPWSEVGSR